MKRNQQKFSLLDPVAQARQMLFLPSLKALPRTSLLTMSISTRRRIYSGTTDSLVSPEMRSVVPLMPRRGLRYY